MKDVPGQIGMKYFVVKVILHAPPGRRPRPVRFSDMDLVTKGTVLLMVQAGELCQLPDGCICEGVKEFRHEEDAHRYRDDQAMRFPSEDFRVAATSAAVIG